MSFQPYVIQAERLPKLNIGHCLKINGKHYVIIGTKRARIEYTIAGTGVGYVLNKDTLVGGTAIYAPLAGNLQTGDVVHIQYMALEDAVNTYVEWGINPLETNDVATLLFAQLAPKSVGSPFEVDRWSYDASMRLRETHGLGVIQHFVFEVIAYKVSPWLDEKKPPVKYLEIMSIGEAAFTPPDYLNAYVMMQSNSSNPMKL